MRRFVVYGEHPTRGGTEQICKGNDEKRSCKNVLKARGYKKIGHWEAESNYGDSRIKKRVNRDGVWRI